MRSAPVIATVVAVAIALLAPAMSRAAGPLAHDPRLRWRTVETPHFRLHFHDGLDGLAQRAAVEFEAARTRLEPFLGVPRGVTEVVLSDDTDDANGFATVVPYRAVHLFTVPPGSLSELNDHRDWLRTLVTHEYTHIVHMDQATGVPGLLNGVFGKLFVPNGFLPPWFIEGLAVLHEGDDERTGRNASAIFSMYQRAQVAEHGLPQLDDVTNLPLDWPRGTSWYLYGGRFLEFIERREGDEALRAFVEDQGSQIWPWRSSTLAGRDLGGRWERLWRDYRDAIQRETAARLDAIRAEGATAFRVLTRRGGRVENPRWSPDGRFIVYFDQGLEELPGIRRVTPEGRDLGRVLRVDGNGTLSLRSPREAIVAKTEIHDEFYAFDDLWSVDLDGGGARQLTHGERASEPDVVDGGRAVIFVSQRPPGRAAIRRIDLATGAVTTLLERPGDELFFPRLSPDGTRLAFEVQHGGRRDVAWSAIGSGELHLVTDDDAIDAQPAWSPDGQRLYFASDRGGIYDLWAHDVGDGSTWRVTRVETGAFEPAPSPDGKTLAFVTYSSRGFDLAVMDVPEAAGAERLEAVRAEPVDPGRAERVEAGTGAPAYPVRSYSPFPTVLPHWWLPVLGTDGGGNTVGVLTGGADVVGRHAWALAASWGLQSEKLSYDAAYQAGWTYPILSIASRRFVGTVEGPSDQLESRWTPLALAATVTRTRIAAEQALTLGWRAYHLQALGGGVPDVQDPSVDPYRNGTASEWSLTLTHASAARFAHSISPEEGRVLTLGFRLATPAAGGDFSYAISRASWAEYLRIPGTRHVVLGLRGSGGYATGTLGGRRPFSIGGVPPADALSLITGPLLGIVGTSPDLLRGYPDGALTGSKFALGNLELRFPLLSPQAGMGTVPVQVRRVHGAVFLDGGGTFPLRNGSPISWRERIRFGTGAELRLELVLGYQLRTDLRLGFAQGLGRLLAPWRTGPGADPLAETQFYVALGESF